MHVIIAILYGFSIWIVSVLYSAFMGEDALTMFLCGPLIISGAAALLLGVEAGVNWLMEAAYPERR